jgi:hypothetical protein
MSGAANQQRLEGRARRTSAVSTMSLPMIVGLVLVSVFAFAALRRGLYGFAIPADRAGL